MTEQQQITFETMKRWIASCVTTEQLGVTHDAVIQLYDNRYHAAGSPESELLHKQCIERSVQLRDAIGVPKSETHNPDRN